MAIPSPTGDLKIVFSVSTVGAKYIDTQIKYFFYLLSHDSHLVVDRNLLISVRRLPRPSGSMHLGDVSETNGWDNVIRNVSATRNNEA